MQVYLYKLIAKVTLWIKWFDHGLAHTVQDFYTHISYSHLDATVFCSIIFVAL